MQRIHFVFPQTADAIFNLIRFQDTTCLGTLLVAFPFPSSVSHGVNELVVCVWCVYFACAGTICILKTNALIMHVYSPPVGYHYIIIIIIVSAVIIIPERKGHET